MRTVDGNTKACSCFGKWHTFPQKLKIEPTHDPVITLLAVNPKELKTGSQKRHFHTRARSSVIDSKCRAEAGLPWRAPAATIPRFLCRGAGSVPGPETKIPHAAGYSQKFKKRINQIFTVFKKRWK